MRSLVPLFFVFWATTADRQVNAEDEPKAIFMCLGRAMLAYFVFWVVIVAIGICKKFT